MSNDPKKSLGIGLAGFGTVGTGVWETLERNADLIFNRSDVEVDIVRIAVRDLNKVRIEGVSEDKFTTNWQDVVNDPEVNIVVELIGGTDTAFDIVAAALRAGKPVVTGNKALLAERGQEVFLEEALASQLPGHGPGYERREIPAMVDLIARRRGFIFLRLSFSRIQPYLTPKFFCYVVHKTTRNLNKKTLVS